MKPGEKRYQIVSAGPMTYITKEHALHELCDRLRTLRATLGTALTLVEDVRQMEGLEEAARTELHDAVATAYQTATEYTLNVQVRLEQDVIWG